MEKAVSGTVLVLLLLGCLELAFKYEFAETQAGTWTVDDNGPARIHDVLTSKTEPQIMMFQQGGTIFNSIL